MEILGETLDEVYTKMVSAIMDQGRLVSPRGMLVREVEGLSVIINNPGQHIITNEARSMDIRFALGEFLWYITGQNSLDYMEFYNKRYRLFSDDNLTLHGAYGPRIFDNQWENAKSLLIKDSDTRQAVINIYDQHVDSGVVTKDVPCTVAIQFLIRGGKLDMFVFMRSNDMIWGFPYDSFSFTLLQEYMAYELDIPMGKYHHYVVSAHIYSKHFDMAREIGRVVGDPVDMNINFANLQKSVLDEQKARKLRQYAPLSDEGFISYFSEILNLELADRQEDWSTFLTNIKGIPQVLRPLVKWRH